MIFEGESGADTVWTGQLSSSANQGQFIYIGGIQAFTIDGNRALGDIKTRQSTIVQLRCTRGQGHIGSIDETATIDRNTVWIGDDQIGSVTSDFMETIDVRTICARDLVDDGTG